MMAHSLHFPHSSWLLSPPPRSLSPSSPLIESLSLPPVHSGNECLSCKFPSDLWNECQKQRLQLCFLTKGSLLFQERLVVLLPPPPPPLPLPPPLAPLPSHSRCLIPVSSPGLLFAERFTSSWDTGSLNVASRRLHFHQGLLCLRQGLWLHTQEILIILPGNSGGTRASDGRLTKNPPKNGSSSLEKYHNQELCWAQSVFFCYNARGFGGPQRCVLCKLMHKTALDDKALPVCNNRGEHR